MKEVKKLRFSNFELLRIISMLMIILHHFVVHSYYHPFSHNTNFINDFIIFFFRSGGKLGVALFTMIIGYFMIYSNFNCKKLLLLEIQVLFTSIFIFLIFSFYNIELFTFKNIFTYFFPNINKVFWFFSSYFVLYLFIPYLNKLLLALDKKNFLKLLLFGFVFLILLPSFFVVRGSITNTIYLFYYYIIGVYIRIFGIKRWNKISCFFGFLFSYLSIILISLLIREFSFDYFILENYIFHFSKLDSIFIFSSSLFLFLFFEKLSLGRINLINKFSSTSFEVYLFHDHPLIRDFLWKNNFSIINYIDSVYLGVYGVFVAIFIYILGSIFELIRRIIFKFFRFCFLKLYSNI